MKKYWFLLAGVCLLSCQTPQQQMLPETVRYEKNTLHSLCDLFQSIEVIRLDHQNQITLGEFVHILQRDSSFYIGDLSGTKLIYRFNQKGQFLDSIGKIGRGPGEYIRLKDFFVDDSTNDTFILSYPEIRLSHYDKSGRFLDLKTAPYGAQSFTKIQDRYWVYTGINNGYLPEQIVQLDTALHLIHSSMPLRTKAINVSLGSFLQWKDQNFLTMAFNPNLYQIQGDSLSPLIHFDYKEKAIPDSYWKTTDPFESVMNLQNNGFCTINAAWVNDRYYLVEHLEQIGSQNVQCHYLYSIKDRKTGKWDWIRQEIPNRPQGETNQAVPSKNLPPYWYITKIKGFTQDGRLMVMMNGADLDLLTKQDRALLSNPEQLKNTDPEMDVFLFLCSLGK